MNREELYQMTRSIDRFLGLLIVVSIGIGGVLMMIGVIALILRSIIL